MPSVDTRQRVRTAALELFAARGFSATGIREIADRVGITSASLYHYMGTKEQLLADMMRTGMGDVVRAGALIEEHCARPEERIAALVRFHVQMHALRRLETSVLDSEMRSLEETAHTEVVELRDEYDRVWDTAIAAGLADGTFRDVDRKYARLALLEMCTGVGRWYSADGECTPEELGHRYAEMALALLGAHRDGKRLTLDHLALPDGDWFRQLALGENGPDGGRSTATPPRG